MYEGQANMAKAQISQLGMDRSNVSPTLEQNIDQRITNLQEQIQRLQAVKEKLVHSGMLDIPIDDLRYAMSY